MKRVVALPEMSSWAIRPEATEAGAAQTLQTRSAADSRFTAIFTLVLWVSCSLIGLLGFAMPYARPLAAKPSPAPMQVEMLNVELTSAPLPDLAPPPVANSVIAPPAAQPILQPNLPQPTAVALLSPAVAVAVPVEGPTRIVEAAQASYTATRADDKAVATPVAPAVQTLTYGQGAGKQPAPEYPWRAQNEGQEGVVNVRFIVGENGRVISAETVGPSPWPLLNESAVRTIRNRWRFHDGAPRAYEVAIRFVLPKERL